MFKHFCSLAVSGIFAALSTICLAQNATSELAPFDSYIRVAEKIFVYDRSQFSPYSGPDVSHWELKVTYTSDEADHEFDRKRLGAISLTPELRVYLDVLGDPMSGYYELRSVKNGELIHTFKYDRAPLGQLLFSGQGVVYEFRQPEFFCYESTTTTNKFLYNKGKLVEVTQALHYLNNAETTLMGDLDLFSEPSLKGSRVASLPKGAKVFVLSYKHSQTRDPSDSWYLIKTPLGLTGWIPGGLEITFCD